jgi:hypothetical protein
VNSGFLGSDGVIFSILYKTFKNNNLYLLGDDDVEFAAGNSHFFLK